MRLGFRRPSSRSSIWPTNRILILDELLVLFVLGNHRLESVHVRYQFYLRPKLVDDVLHECIVALLFRNRLYGYGLYSYGLYSHGLYNYGIVALLFSKKIGFGLKSTEARQRGSGWRRHNGHTLTMKSNISMMAELVMLYRLPFSAKTCRPN